VNRRSFADYPDESDYTAPTWDEVRWYKCRWCRDPCINEEGSRPEELDVCGECFGPGCARDLQPSVQQREFLRVVEGVDGAGLPELRDRFRDRELVDEVPTPRTLRRWLNEFDRVGLVELRGDTRDRSVHWIGDSDD